MSIYSDSGAAYALTYKIIQNDIIDLLDSIKRAPVDADTFTEIKNLKECINELERLKTFERSGDPAYKLASVLAYYFYSIDPYGYDGDCHIDEVNCFYNDLCSGDSEELKPVIEQLEEYRADFCDPTDGDAVKAGELISEIKKYIKEA